VVEGGAQPTAAPQDNEGAVLDLLSRAWVVASGLRHELAAAWQIFDTSASSITEAETGRRPKSDAR